MFSEYLFDTWDCTIWIWTGLSSAKMNTFSLLNVQ